MEKIYKKYNVEDYAGLMLHFKMLTSKSLGELNINDSSLYYSPSVILEKVRLSGYNPTEENILLMTTFLNSFYGISFESFTEMIEEIGTFRVYLFLKDVLEENTFYDEYLGLYNQYLKRLNNVGIILVTEGRDLIKKLENFALNLNEDSLKKALDEAKVAIENLGIFNKEN